MSGFVTSFNEGAVEAAALSWLDINEWRVLPGDYLAPDGPMGARTDYRQTVLEAELRSALATLNPIADARMIESAVRLVLAAPSRDLLENNRAFHAMLIEGVPVETNANGETQYSRLRLIDRAILSNNRFIAANQFVAQGERETVRPDVVLFVNGLPLAVFEIRARPTRTRRWSVPSPAFAVRIVVSVNAMPITFPKRRIGRFGKGPQKGPQNFLIVGELQQPKAVNARAKPTDF